MKKEELDKIIKYEQPTQEVIDAWASWRKWIDDEIVELYHKGMLDGLFESV